MTVNRAETSEKFQFVSGMRIPDLSGTGNEYYVDSWWDGGWKTAAISNTGNTTYAISYFPATFYLPVAAPAPDGYKTDDASRPVIKGACGPGCDLRRYQIKSGNYSSPPPTTPRSRISPTGSSITAIACWPSSVRRLPPW